jgi:hypothetical protein
LGAETARAGGPILVQSDGSITVNPAMSAFQPAAVGQREPIRYDFGLPRQPPALRALAEGSSAVLQTGWTRHGIRYTQTVLLTRLAAGDLLPGGTVPADAVLLVQIKGENTASEYAEASAQFAVAVGTRSLPLELREGSVWVAETNQLAPLAVVDVSPSGVTGTNGTALQFRGFMPPATSGTMTFKIPSAKLTGSDALDRLRDLAFEDELRRVQRYWAERANPGVTAPPPLSFAEAQSHGPGIP